MRKPLRPTAALAITSHGKDTQLIASIRPKINAHSLVGHEVVYDQFGYEPHFLRDKIGTVVDATDDDQCLVRFEIDSRQVILSIPARELVLVKNGGEV